MLIIIVILDYVMTELVPLSQSCHFAVSCIGIPWSSRSLVRYISSLWPFSIRFHIFLFSGSLFDVLFHIGILPTCLQEPKLRQSWIGITQICVVVQVRAIVTPGRSYWALFKSFTICYILWLVHHRFISRYWSLNFVTALCFCAMFWWWWSNWFYSSSQTSGMVT